MKILIIGQAPPLQTQKVPYDTTLLYDMLSWVNITKEQAQEMFEFEAMSNTLRGVKNGNHLQPLVGEMRERYYNVLREKIGEANKVILLGNVAKYNCFKFGINSIKFPQNILCLIHPSRRNYNKIMANKEEITNKLKVFLYELN